MKPLFAGARFPALLIALAALITLGAPSVEIPVTALRLIGTSPNKSRYFCPTSGSYKKLIWVLKKGKKNPISVSSKKEYKRLINQARLVKSVKAAKKIRSLALTIKRGCLEVAPEPITTATPTAPSSSTPLGPSPSPTPFETPAPLQMTNTLTQNGITFTFDKAYPYGNFVTGDYWVIGPVTITSISPDFTGMRNGFEVSPVSPLQQGFDNLANNFSSTRVPTLPVVVPPGRAVIKSVGLENPAHAKIKTAMIVTVLATAPAQDSFRPGYAAINQPIYRLSALKLDRLPSKSFAGSKPSLDSIETQFQKPWIDHLSNWVGRLIHPADHMPDYGSQIAAVTTTAALRFMLDDPVSDRRNAMIGYIQYGIDLRSMLRIGTELVANGGHCLGRIVPLAFAAALLDDPAFSAGLPEALEAMHEPNSVVSGVGGRALWGQPGTGNEYDYWRNQLADVGSRTVPDPYGYIDGGKIPGGTYDFCCNVQAFKGLTLVFSMMPSLKSFFDNQKLFTYAKRWVTQGSWAQPDPCAPLDPIDIAACALQTNKYQCALTKYGITYGPDGQGGCILDSNPSDGIGRHPTRHNLTPNGGYYGSALVNALWVAFPPA